MGRVNNATAWVQVGYEIFADEGTDGIQVERLARILNLNKSAFYHYFGDLDHFYDALLKMHEEKANHYIEDMLEAKTIDPDYMNVAVKHAMACLFQMKLVKCKPSSTFFKTADSIDKKIILIVQNMWAEYIGYQDQPAMAMQYYGIVRDMLYTRLNSSTLNYPGLQSLMAEAKEMMLKTHENKSKFETDDSIIGIS